MLHDHQQDLEILTMAWTHAKAISELQSHATRVVESHLAMHMHTQLHTLSCDTASMRMLTGRVFVQIW